jgi:hypothetical protein
MLGDGGGIGGVRAWCGGLEGCGIIIFLWEDTRSLGYEQGTFKKPG